ncbi:hypothetical protein HJFPF1_04268 [Paramyrothecium foliicola]|nr:hypothetical protein HJFPF1_04268 [Paramyrothecium foliicola]
MQFSIICQQVISSTSILDSWHVAFQWQWGAAIVLVGSISAPHHDSPMSEERKALDLAISARMQDRLSTVLNVNHAMADPLQEQELIIIWPSLGPSNSGNEHGSNDMMDFDLFDVAVGVDFESDLDVL